MISVGGEDDNGVAFVFMELISGAFGGRLGLDGLEGVASPIVNAQNTSCELIEATYPLRIEHYGFVPDSGGEGKYRGGLAVRRDVRFLGRRAMLQIRSDRGIVQPWGLAGGRPGSNSSNLLFPADGPVRELPSKIVTEIGAGCLWRHTTASGGGWGDPAGRSVEARARDLAEGKTVEGRGVAARLNVDRLGFVQHPDSLVDSKARALEDDPVQPPTTIA